MISGVNNEPIRKAKLEDIDAIKKIADAHKKELGFLRRPTLLASIERGEIFVAQNGTGIIGFVEYHHRLDEQTTLYNIVVKSEYHRHGYGQKLVKALINEAQTYNKWFIQLKCPTDLASNKFYEALHFTLNTVEDGKQRPLHVWRKKLTPSPLLSPPDLTAQATPAP